MGEEGPGRGVTPGTFPGVSGSTELGSREAEQGEALLGEVRGACATSSQGEEEFTSHTQEADVMHTCVHLWWPGCGWVQVHICQVNF